MRVACHMMLRSFALASRVGAFAPVGTPAFARGLVAVRMQATDTAPVPTLDEKLIAEDPELIKRTLTMRRADESQLEAVDRIGELTKLRAAAVAEGNEAREARKKLSPKIGALLKNGEAEEAEKLKAEVAASAKIADAADERLGALDAERSSLFSTLPNLLDPRTVDGNDEDANIEVSSWQCDDLPTERLWHDEFGAALGGLDMDAASKLSGARFSVLKGGVARLERALINFFLDMHTGEHGYTELMVPYLVGKDALQGTGQLPKFEEDLFKLAEPLNGREGYLIPTAEVPITNLHAGEMLDESKLPLSYCAFTPCFRAEAGSYGKDTRGLFRQHQFHKVELVKICTPEQADAQHHELVAHAEKCLQASGTPRGDATDTRPTPALWWPRHTQPLSPRSPLALTGPPCRFGSRVRQALELPYRKMQLCSGDIGFSARLCYDLEVWLPGQGRFREISSCSNCADFQGRRMNLRYRPSERDEKGKPKKPVFCHTINGSGLAVGRTLVALLENYQNEDGSLTVPEVLRPYMGGKEKILPE